MHFCGIPSIKILYFLLNYSRLAIPKKIYRNLLSRHVRAIANHPQFHTIETRAAYYNTLKTITPLDSSAVELGAFTYRSKFKSYFFDLNEYTRYFSPHLKISYEFGDVTTIPHTPSIVKTRPLSQGNEHAILFKLNKYRHFKFVNDSIPFMHKKDKLVARMSVYQPHRLQFFDMYFDASFCDLGQVNTRNGNPRYIKPFMSIAEQLQYKYILCIEGNEVASNLKWVLSSNSIAVMPTPKFESWFMEGLLIPDYHYIHIADDYSNVQEKLEYYITHPEQAQKIIDNAHTFVSQFTDANIESLVAIRVLQTYFEKTGQL